MIKLKTRRRVRREGCRDKTNCDVTCCRRSNRERRHLSKATRVQLTPSPTTPLLILPLSHHGAYMPLYAFIPNRLICAPMLYSLSHQQSSAVSCGSSMSSERIHQKVFVPSRMRTTCSMSQELFRALVRNTFYITRRHRCGDEMTRVADTVCSHPRGHTIRGRVLQSQVQVHRGVPSSPTKVCVQQSHLVVFVCPVE